MAERRRVAFPGSTIERPRRYATKQGERWLAIGPGYTDRDLVFATVNGRSIHPNIVSRAYAKLIERAGVPRIQFHDLRHTSATLLLASGEHPKVVQERLGHASISETLDGYSHVSADMQQPAAARFDALFDEATGTE
jgi:integrase